MPIYNMGPFLATFLYFVAVNGKALSNTSQNLPTLLKTQPLKLKLEIEPIKTFYQSNLFKYPSITTTSGTIHPLLNSSVTKTTEIYKEYESTKPFQNNESATTNHIITSHVYWVVTNHTTGVFKCNSSRPSYITSESYKTSLKPSSIHKFTATIMNKFSETKPSTNSPTVLHVPSLIDIAQKDSSEIPLSNLPEDYTTSTKTSSSKPAVVNTYSKTSTDSRIVLGYKPSRPPYVPNPVTIPQKIPPGTPWPNSPEGYTTSKKPSTTNSKTTIENRFAEVESSTECHTVLGYKPTRPGCTPDSITTDQRNPARALWPDSPEGDTTSNEPPLTNSETTIKSNFAEVESTTKSHTILEYKPTRPGFAPDPITIGQRIPPGTPWPDSPEGYTTSNDPPLTNSETTIKNNFAEVESTTKSHTILEYKPTRPGFAPDPITTGQRIPPGTPWPDSPEGYMTSNDPPPTNSETIIENNFAEVESTTKSHIILEYKPTRPGFAPDPITIGQRIPPGTPWPDSPEGYSTSKKPLSTNSETTIANRFPEVESSTKFHIILDYKPTRPGFAPDPITIGQRIPPGTPWPDSPQGYTSKKPLPVFSQTNIVNRFPEIETTTKHHTILDYKPIRPGFAPNAITTGQRIPPGSPWPDSPEGYTKKSTIPQRGTTHIILGYKPQRPWYVQGAGHHVGPSIPPGTPWPASLEGYSTFGTSARQPLFTSMVQKIVLSNAFNMVQTSDLERRQPSDLLLL